MSEPATQEALPKIDRQRGFLGFVERVGNVLPDPVMIFVWLIAFLMILSAIGASLGWSASLPFAGAEAPTGGVLKDGILTYSADSLFSEANLNKIIVDMPKTMTGFAPLGLILVIMLGASVAERSGMFSALIRARSGPDAMAIPSSNVMVSTSFGGTACSLSHRSTSDRCVGSRLR